MRFEMIEFIARVAVLWAERKLTASPVAGIHILGEELFKNNLPAVVCGRWGVVFDVELIPAALEKQALMNADDFRKYRLYNARAHRVLAKNQKTLRTVFNNFVGYKTASVDKRSRMYACIALHPSLLA